MREDVGDRLGVSPNVGAGSGTATNPLAEVEATLFVESVARGGRQCAQVQKRPVEEPVGQRGVVPSSIPKPRFVS